MHLTFNFSHLDVKRIVYILVSTFNKFMVILDNLKTLTPTPLCYRTIMARHTVSKKRRNMYYNGCQKIVHIVYYYKHIMLFISKLLESF